MKKKYIIGISSAVAVVLVVVIVLSINTKLIEDCTISGFGSYKADTTYLLGFSYKKQGIMPVSIKEIQLLGEDGNKVQNEAFGWSILKNEDTTIIGGLIYDETNPIIDYNALKEFKSGSVDKDGINLALKLENHEERNNDVKYKVKVKYSVLGIQKNDVQEMEN